MTAYRDRRLAGEYEPKKPSAQPAAAPKPKAKQKK